MPESVKQRPGDPGLRWRAVKLRNGRILHVAVVRRTGARPPKPKGA